MKVVLLQHAIYIAFSIPDLVYERNGLQLRKEISYNKLLSFLIYIVLQQFRSLHCQLVHNIQPAFL